MEKNRKIYIWSLFIFSLIVLFTNFTFLIFWYATRNGLQNGFVIGNTDYSIIHWSMKISYLSCMAVVAWSGFEVIGMYYPQYRPRFIFRYFVIYWISVTMIGESYSTVVKMIPRFEAMYDAVFNGGAWNGVDGFWYSLIDAFQFISIHVTIPILVIVYASIYRENEVLENEVFKGVMLFLVVWICWWMYDGILSLIGVPAAYPIIDWTPNDVDDSMKIWIQSILIFGAGFGSMCISYIVLKYMSIKTSIE